MTVEGIQGAKKVPIGTLSYRVATPNDLPLLRQYRTECGWGKDRVDATFGSEDWAYCVFSVERDGAKEDVGMGGWKLDDPEDQPHASRAQGIVCLGECFFPSAPGVMDCLNVMDTH